jgi:hypothetical protein
MLKKASFCRTDENGVFDVAGENEMRGRLSPAIGEGRRKRYKYITPAPSSAASGTLNTGRVFPPFAFAHGASPNDRPGGCCRAVYDRRRIRGKDQDRFRTERPAFAPSTL